MTTKNTATKKTTTTKAKATATKAVAAPKEKEPVTVLRPAGSKIAIPPKEVNVIFCKDILEEFKNRSDKINESMAGIDFSLETIALNLYWIYYHMAYKAAGCDTIVQYAKKVFGYEKTTCYAFIAIVERFANRDEDGNLLEEFDPRYKDYSFSKLSLMVGLTDEQIEKTLKPSMSVRDIKNFIKSVTDNSVESLPDGSGKDDTSRENAGNDSSVVSSKGGFYSLRLFLIYDFDDYINKLDKIDDVIHKLYKEMPNVKIRIEIDSEEPISEKWGE